MTTTPPRGSDARERPAAGKSAESANATARLAGYEPLAIQLEEVEARLAASVRHEQAELSAAAGHLLTAGGKRVRPALTLMCADAARPGSALPEAVDAAVAVELVHLGSLHHDDVIDEASVRRGIETVNARWSNSVAVLSGDFLLARASEITASLGQEPAAILAWTIGELVAGEMIELSHLHDTEVSVETYYRTIGSKTAALMGTACKLGALVAGASDRFVDTAFRFGLQLGHVFQIVDDVLDLIADESQTGKARGIDLVEGVYTLPTLLALDTDDGGLRRLLAAIPAPDALEDAIGYIEASGAIARSVDVAAGHLAHCDALLEEFPTDGPRTALRRLSRYVLGRVPSDAM